MHTVDVCRCSRHNFRADRHRAMISSLTANRNSWCHTPSSLLYGLYHCFQPCSMGKLPVNNAPGSYPLSDSGVRACLHLPRHTGCCRSQLNVQSRRYIRVFFFNHIQPEFSTRQKDRYTSRAQHSILNCPYWPAKTGVSKSPFEN